MKKIVFISICICLLLSGCRNNTPETAITYDSVDDINAEAQKLYDNGDYTSSLTKYSEAIAENPTDINSIIGVAQCQIALENYSMACTNLSAAIWVKPTDYRIYDLYVQMSEESENISYARTAVTLAQTYNVTEFLNKVPNTPEINQPEGMYDSKFEVEISAPNGSEIYVAEKKGNSYISYEYHEPVTITRGNTDLEVYCVVDGIPSDTATAKFVCDYPPIEVSFVDPIIEQLVRLTLNKEFETITDVDCESITNIRQYNLTNNGMSWDEYENLHVSSLADMSLFPNLQQLDLENIGDITDFSVLASCKSLSSIDFSDGNIQDISFVEYLPNLEYCRLSDNNISDLSPLLNCKNLYGLYIDENPISNLSVLEGLDLEDISVTATYLDDLSVFGKWENLDYLQLYGCGGCDLTALGQLSNLRYLYLYACDYSQDDWDSKQSPLDDISFLENLTNIEHLNIQGLLSYNQLSVVKSLSSLTELYVETLDYSSLPDNIRQDLQSSLPKCTINN
ncbi:hypothetical protein C809_00173 [Lachnospiraceae bacterium MD335]|nr:hypothetical protein C809_00173 [Lachnospiraceae bacterium MD335]